jgi:antitoxin component YwqK of YwqJK toxin-antitoxin module
VYNINEGLPPAQQFTIISKTRRSFMYRILCILTLTIMISAPASAWWEIKYDTTEIKWPNGNLKERYTSRSDAGNEKGFIRNGQYNSWYENGNRHEEGEYLDGRKQFTWVTWYEDGQRAEEACYDKGEKTGLNIAWYTNHDIKFIAPYRDGDLHGLYTRRKTPYDLNHPDLCIIEQKFYLFGQLIMTYYENGAFLHGAGSYYNKDLDWWIETAEDFSRFAVGNKVKGEKDGQWITWLADGTKENVECYDKGLLIEDDNCGKK